MKLIILFLSAIIIYGNEIILSKKEKKTEKYLKTQEVNIKTFSFSRTFNDLMPDFLQTSPDSSIKFKYEYEVFSKKTNLNVKARIKLVEISKILKKIKFLNTKKEKNYQLSLKLYLRLRRGLPTIMVKPFFSFEKKNNSLTLMKSIVFNEYIEYYSIFIDEYREVTELFFKELFNQKDLLFKAQKTFKSIHPKNIYYNFGIYKYIHIKKKTSHTLGFVIYGEKEKEPFINSYKIFYSFRRLIFNKDYFFLNVTPGIIVSREDNYKIKPYLNLSFNFKF